MGNTLSELNEKVREMVRTAAREARGPADAVERAIEIAEWLTGEIADRNIDGLDKIACRAGCAWCCYQQVGVTAAQALHIASAVRAGGTDLGPEGVLGRLAALDGKTRGLSAPERLRAALPCAFLEDNRCTIYAIRPFACRGANSVDAEFCRRTVEEPESLHAEWERSGGQEWVHTAPFRAMQAVQEGLRDGLAETGLPDERLELTAAVRIALEEPDAEERWRNGDDVFAQARLP